jgi:(2Fe-2S) ferredoxin
MSHFAHHIFFCLNTREPGEQCCADHNPREMQQHAKARCKALNLNGPGKVRINQAGCLDRCEHGPVCVVYPEAVWYSYVDKEDIDEIIDSHVVGGKIVERLQIK